MAVSRGFIGFAFGGVANAIGTGFYFPFSLLLFANLLHLQFSLVGLIMTAANLVALPMLTFAGRLIDIIGSKCSVVWSQAVRAICLVGVLLAPSVPVFVTTSVLSALAGRFEMAAVQSLARDGAGSASGVPRWMATSRAVFSAGFAVGALGAGLALSLGTSVVAIAGYANAASFVLSALLYALVPRTSRMPSTEAGSTGPQGSVRPVYLLLIIVNSITTASILLVETYLVPLSARGTDVPNWLSPALLAGNAIVLALLYLPASGFISRMPQMRVITLSAFLLVIGNALIFSCQIIHVSSWAPTALIVGMTLITLGELGSSQVLGVLLVLLPHRSRQGQSLSLGQAVSGATAALVPSAAGAIVDADSPIPFVLPLAALALAGAIVLLPIARQLDRPVDAIGVLPGSSKNAPPLAPSE